MTGSHADTTRDYIGRMKTTLLALLLALPASAQSIDALIDRELPALVATYKTMHSSPELSMKEEKSSARLAARLRELGYTVTERVGKYEDPAAVGYGVVAILKNGDGPVVLVRSDMDGLPVAEQTSLPYASANAGVMHACGHDVHMTTLLGTASMLAQLKSRWHGTVMLIGQPAEEVNQGASAMLRDGLYERFPKPNFVLALHDHDALPAGTIGYRAGYFMAAVDSVNLTIRGMGGHGAKPQLTKDPVVIAAQVVLGLQTLVSRENSPLDPVVVTVGSIHGGTKRNIIPDQVQLLLTVRTYKPEVRKRVLAGIERVAKGIASAAGVPDDRAPLIEFVEKESGEATYNDPALTNRIVAALKRDMGSGITEIEPLMVSEDFGRLGLGGQIPVLMLNLGAVDPAKIAAGGRLPGLHSSEFAPLPEPTLRGGIKGMTLAVLELLK
jgi:hippurate hydrolase